MFVGGDELPPAGSRTSPGEGTADKKPIGKAGKGKPAGKIRKGGCEIG
jgi:hypothetical protein